jgi:ABC-type amino acid transport substrate-binding protein
MFKALFLSAVLLFPPATSLAADAALRVGVHEKPPFATKGEAGEWEGIGVEIWERIASAGNLRFELVEMPYPDILPAVRDGRLDLAIGEFEITAEDEENIDFTQPFLRSSIGVAVLSGRWHPDWGGVIRDFLTWSLGLVFLAIIAGLFVVSLLIWALERNHQHGHFRGGIHGFGSALWFAAVTMTTVGYGDKTPATLAGRLVAIVWMLVGLVLVTSLTAALAAGFATARLNEMILQPSDLHRVTCGAIGGSASSDLLVKQGVAVRRFDELEDGVRALMAGEIGALVGNRLSLAYAATVTGPNARGRRLILTPLTLREAQIGIPVRPGLPEFDDINLTVLRITASDEWQQVLQRWLGLHARAQ